MNSAVRFFAVALLIAAAGCKSKDQQAASAATDSAATARAAQAAPPAPAAQTMPPSLEKAEGLAEDVQDDIATGKWAGATARADSLSTIKTDLAAQSSPDKLAAFNLGLDSLKAAIAKKAKFAALNAGNGLSRTLTEMMATFKAKNPIEVGYMDVAARDAEYAAEQSQWDKVAAAAAELQKNYSVVQDHVKQKDAKLDADVTREIDELAKAGVAKQRAKVVSLAKKLLEDVDKIEATY